jgi:hypothetical protein
MTVLRAGNGHSGGLRLTDDFSWPQTALIIENNTPEAKSSLSIFCNLPIGQEDRYRLETAMGLTHEASALPKPRNGKPFIKRGRGAVYINFELICIDLY